jgi:hypothetical protein
LTLPNSIDYINNERIAELTDLALRAARGLTSSKVYLLILLTFLELCVKVQLMVSSLFSGAQAVFHQGRQLCLFSGL